jgi:hypothetical protein
MENDEILFLSTYQDIENRLNAKEPYEILYISALIRELFLDDFPLVDQVNKNYKLKILFKITETQAKIPGLPMPIFYSVHDGFDPDTAIRPGFRIIEVNRNKFFKACVLAIRGKEYSVREIILFEANIMGGVHASTAKTDKEKALKQIDSLFIGGYRSSLGLLKAIARVILKALEPLKKIIEQSIL